MSIEHTTNWPDLAIALYERLTGQNALISYQFEDMHVKVPSGTGAKAEHAEWVLNGIMKIRTGGSDPLPN
jgi:hypothetical protein